MGRVTDRQEPHIRRSEQTQHLGGEVSVRGAENRRAPEDEVGGHVQPLARFRLELLQPRQQLLGSTPLQVKIAVHESAEDLDRARMLIAGGSQQLSRCNKLTVRSQRDRGVQHVRQTLEGFDAPVPALDPLRRPGELEIDKPRIAFLSRGGRVELKELIVTHLDELVGNERASPRAVQVVTAALIPLEVPVGGGETQLVDRGFARLRGGRRPDEPAEDLGGGAIAMRRDERGPQFVDVGALSAVLGVLRELDELGVALDLRAENEITDAKIRHPSVGSLQRRLT